MEICDLLKNGLYRSFASGSFDNKLRGAHGLIPIDSCMENLNIFSINRVILAKTQIAATPNRRILIARKKRFAVSIIITKKQCFFDFGLFLRLSPTRNREKIRQTVKRRNKSVKRTSCEFRPLKRFF